MSIEPSTLSNIYYLNELKNFYYINNIALFTVKKSILHSFLSFTNNTNLFYNFMCSRFIYYPYYTVGQLFNLIKYNYGIIVSRKYFTLITKVEYLVELAKIFKNSQLFNAKFLMDICVTDYPQRVNRFEVLHCFLSSASNTRFFVKSFVGELGAVASLCEVFQSANWLEREAWDLYGVFFVNHPNLRRILTDYGFKGFPFRKDFPLTGYVEVRYDDEVSAIVYEPLEVSQEYRSFNFRSPWEDFVV